MGRLDSEESPVRENGLTEGALRYPNLIWALTKHERERPKVISEEKRSVLILGPGAPSVPLKAVHQLHELAPFFMNDKISVVDNSEKVISAIKNSYTKCL